MFCILCIRNLHYLFNKGNAHKSQISFFRQLKKKIVEFCLGKKFLTSSFQIFSLFTFQILFYIFIFSSSPFRLEDGLFGSKCKAWRIVFYKFRQVKVVYITVKDLSLVVRLYIVSIFTVSSIYFILNNKMTLIHAVLG